MTLGAENPVTLEPGNYQLLLRFVPDKFTSEAEEIRNDPALYAMQIFLDPEQQLSLSKGPATVSFVADSKPLFLWKGESVKSVRGYELFCSTGTHLKVIIPSELTAEEDVKYVVCLSSDNIDESIQIPVETSPEGQFDIDIANACRQWKPGVIRLLAELQRIGIQRPLIRSAVFLWNGLQQIKDKTKFCCDPLPSNINSEESDNLLINDENKFLTFRNDDNRFFRIAFNLNDKKRFVFTSVVPGMFMQLKDYAEAQLTERPIKKGSTLSVGSHSRSVLEIFSTTNGTLCLGDFRKKIDFELCSCKRLPLPSLIEYLGPMNNTLQFVDELTGSVEDLIRLVSPHEVLNFSVRQDKYTYKILFALVHEAAAVSIIATDLSSGHIETTKMNCNGNPVRLPSGINGWLTNEYDTEKKCYIHELMISVDRWPCGAWILDFEASINNRWGGLSNDQGDRYSIGFIVTNDDVNKNSNQFIETARFLPPNERVAIIERVHYKLLYRYAIPSWNEIKWIKNILQTLLSDFSENNKYAAQLISLSERNLPQDVSNSWVPRFSIAAYSPWLYSQPIKCYKKIPNKSNSLFIKCLTTMSLLKDGLLPIFQQGVLNQIFAGGFKNVFEMQHGAEPKHFDINRYKQALQAHDLTDRLRLLKQDAWQPGDGDYLGALHYLYSMERLKQCYKNTLSGNDYRRGKALFLVHRMDNYSHGLPKD